MKVLTKIILLSLTLAVFSCDPDDDPQPSTTTNNTTNNTVVTTSTATCNQTVTSWYSEPYSGYNAGYFTGYGQYTVVTVDDWGTYRTYYDATRVPAVGMCWIWN